MPHLSQLQRDYRNQDVTIIGLTSEDSRNTLEMVEEMVADKGDGMDFSVAWDIERQTNEAFMEASNQRGIPTSFLVDKLGNIAWIGHPSQADIPIAYVVADKWDYKQGPAMMEEINDARSAIYKSAKADPKRAYALLTEFRDEYPLAASGLESIEFTILSRLPERLAEATTLGQVIVSDAVAAKNAMSLNGFAWNLVDPEAELDNRFLDLALLAAVKASELSGESDPAILDTVARVHFWRGDLELALKVQERAVEYAKGNMKSSLEQVVGEYTAAIKSDMSY